MATEPISYSAHTSNLANSMEDKLNNHNNSFTKAAGRVGQTFAEAQSLLADAFSLDSGDGTNAEGIAKRLNLKDSDGNYITSSEAIQLAAKAFYDRASRAFTILSQVMQASHSTMMSVIRSIRAS